RPWQTQTDADPTDNAAGRGGANDSHIYKRRGPRARVHNDPGPRQQTDSGRSARSGPTSPAPDQSWSPGRWIAPGLHHTLCFHGEMGKQGRERGSDWRAVLQELRLLWSPTVTKWDTAKLNEHCQTAFPSTAGESVIPLPQTPTTQLRLTYSQLLTEDCPFSQRRTVPASIPELVLTLIDAHLGAFAHNNDGVRAALADGPLARCQPGNLVADD
ncbi:hypothetical protein JOQ06_002723, partial [Pogonophryne albipinna]